MTNEALKSELRESAIIMANLPIEFGVACITEAGAQRIAKALTDAATALEAGGWLPISEAPKDGTFLVYTPTEREDRRYQVMYRQKSLAVIGGCFAFDCDPPTHWMPLPTPPKD